MRLSLRTNAVITGKLNQNLKRASKALTKASVKMPLAFSLVLAISVFAAEKEAKLGPQDLAKTVAGAPAKNSQRDARLQCKTEKKNTTRKQLKDCILDKMGLKPTDSPSPTEKN